LPPREGLSHKHPPGDTDWMEWTERVQAAAVRGDGPALAELFALAVEELGASEANRAWLAAISGYDAEAVTG
jgi:hypothetical protein